MSLPSYAVDFRGHPACPCQARWLPVFEAEAQRRGILTGPLPLSQLIGGAPESGGTHSKGGADDTYPLTGIDVDAYVALSRQMGADAAWYRPPNWDGAGGVPHVHRVLTGCPHNSPARYQLDAVRAGFNGLGYLGHGAPDNGPRPLSGRTWREGIAWVKTQEDNMPFTDWPQKDQDALVNAVAAKVTSSILGADMNAHEPKGSPAFQGKTLRDVIKSIARKTGAV
jgi:hypothetical protein